MKKRSGTMKNRPGTMKNHPRTMKNHENRPDTKKNQSGTMENYENPPLEQTNLCRLQTVKDHTNTWIVKALTYLYSLSVYVRYTGTTRSDWWSMESDGDQTSL